MYFDKKYSFIGYLAALVPIIILPYYSVIGGWVMKYLIVFLTGQSPLAANNTYFTNYTAQIGEPIFWLIMFIMIRSLDIHQMVYCGVIINN